MEQGQWKKEISRMKKILITGANSYIGMAFEKYMEQWKGDYQVDTIDTIDLEVVPELFINYDAVFHVAGIAHIKETKANQSLYYKVNRDLTIKIAEAAKAGAVKQFIVLSSMSVYGKTVGHITKDTIPQPTSAYGISKLQADEIIMGESGADFKVAILRPPMVYGKGCKGNYQMLRKFALKIPFFPSYDNLRSMIYIGNLCEFVKNVLDQEKAGIYFPQNKEYVCTSEMTKLIAKENKVQQKQMKLLNPFIKAIPLGILKKVFGNLTYEKEDCVDKFGFEETIHLSEQKE